MPRRTKMLCLASLLQALATPAFAGTVYGHVTQVKSGDTIVVEYNQPIRLMGIIAPEINQPVGPAARAYMTELVKGKKVICAHNDQRNQDRTIALCFLANADVDIGQSIVRAGFARNCDSFSDYSYIDAEMSAREDGRDLSLTLVLPDYC